MVSAPHGPCILIEKTKGKSTDNKLNNYNITIYNKH